MKEIALAGWLIFSSGNKVVKEIDTPVRKEVLTVPNKDSAIAVEHYKAQVNLKKLKEVNDSEFRK